MVCEFVEVAFKEGASVANVRIKVLLPIVCRALDNLRFFWISTGRKRGAVHTLRVDIRRADMASLRHTEPLEVIADFRLPVRKSPDNRMDGLKRMVLSSEGGSWWT